MNNKSWKTDYSHISSFKRYFAGKYLGEITPHHIDRLKQELIAKVSPATVNRKLAILKCMYGKAIAWHKFSGSNPAKEIKFLKENNHRLRFLEKEEIGTLIANCSGYLKSIVIIALNTGMRRGEILGLKWQDVDLQRELIHLYNTKSGKKREIPINQEVSTALLNLKRQASGEYLFHHRDGEQILDVKKSFLTALRKSGIKDCLFHTLRHSFASHLVMNGVDLNTVRELLGHQTIFMTLRYSHLSPNHKKSAVDVLNKQFVTNLSPDVSDNSIENSQCSLSPLLVLS